GRLAARDEPRPLLRPSRVHVAVGREQVDVARRLDELVESLRPAVAVDGLRARAVDDLDRRAAPECDRRRGDAVRDELPPALGEGALTQLVHARSLPTARPGAPAAAAG